MSCLDRVEQNSPMQHPEIWPKVFGQRVVPVFKFCIRPSGSHLTRSGLLLVCCAVKLVFGSKAAVELVFEVRHEGTISYRLGSIVAEAPIFYCTIVPVVGVGCVRLLA